MFTQQVKEAMKLLREALETLRRIELLLKERSGGG